MKGYKFIAGAVCPNWGDIDSIVLKNDDSIVRCISCDYFEKKDNHFGLNLKSYCNFTSPIRRYADLTVHRALGFALGWEKNSYPLNETLQLICEIINMTERQSVLAERDSADRFSALFIANQKSIIHEANIIGASRFYVFIRLKLFILSLKELQALGLVEGKISLHFVQFLLT